MKAKVMTFHFQLPPCGSRRFDCGHLLFLALRTLFELALTGPEVLIKQRQECVLCFHTEL